MGTLDFGLHKILIYAMKNGQGKGGKYLENEVFSCGGEGGEEAKLLQTGGSIKGPREPKSIR